MITLKTLPQATAQEVFDQVAEHLLTQNKQAVVNKKALVKNTACRYRVLDGLGKTVLKCAGGCLIGNTEYNPEFEGYSWPHLVAEYNLPETHNNLINSLQRVHDRFAPFDWPFALKEVAKVNELSAAIIDKTLERRNA